MWRLWPLFVLLVLPACGPGSSRPAERAAATDPLRYEARTLGSERAFRDAVVGYTLRAPDGFRITLAPDGSFVSRSGSFVYAGTWMYRDGLLCQSFTDNVRRAPGRRCYRVAVDGSEVLMVPFFE